MFSVSCIESSADIYSDPIGLKFMILIVILNGKLMKEYEIWKSRIDGDCAVGSSINNTQRLLAVLEVLFFTDGIVLSVTEMIDF